jgi:glycosyltransferase involved in cell wall biosynthesis
MRIALLIDWHLYYTIQLANALSKNHQVFLVTRDHNYEVSSSESSIALNDFINNILDRGVRRESLRYAQSSLKNIFELIRIYKKIRAFNPEIVHVQDNTDWRILILAKLLGFDKMVLTIHDVFVHPGDSTPIMNIFRSIFIRKAKKIIVHGEFLRTQLLSIFQTFERKIYVVPHGVYTIYREWDDESIKEETHTILFFGRISKYKGIGILVEAEPLISKEIPEVKIILAGRGKGLENYTDQIVNKDRFEIINTFIANKDVPRFFRRAAVVVLPYLEASQSGVVLLAYAFGKPVVVTRVGSIPEIVEHGKTGFIVSPKSPEELARAIMALLKNEYLRKEMSRNVILKASTELSWETIAQKTLEIYTSD